MRKNKNSNQKIPFSVEQFISFFFYFIRLMCVCVCTICLCGYLRLFFFLFCTLILFVIYATAIWWLQYFYVIYFHIKWLILSVLWNGIFRLHTHTHGVSAAFRKLPSRLKCDRVADCFRILWKTAKKKQQKSNKSAYWWLFIMRQFITKCIWREKTPQ